MIVMSTFCDDRVHTHGHTNFIGTLYSYTISILKVIYHPLYSMNNYVLIWGDWLSCDPLRGSHDSQSPHIWGDWLSCDRHMIANHPI